MRWPFLALHGTYVGSRRVISLCDRQLRGRSLRLRVRRGVGRGLYGGWLRRGRCRMRGSDDRQMNDFRILVVSRLKFSAESFDEVLKRAALGCLGGRNQCSAILWLESIRRSVRPETFRLKVQP